MVKALKGETTSAKRQPRPPSSRNPDESDDDAIRARERFRLVADHRPEDHFPVVVDGRLVARLIPREVYARFEKEPWRRAIACLPQEDCGAWWCATPDAITTAETWKDLEKAVLVLKAVGRRVEDAASSRVLSAYHLIELDREQADDVRALAAAIERVSLKPESVASALREQFMKRLRPRLDEAQRAKPKLKRRGNPNAVHLDEAIVVAKDQGLGSNELAALLLLSGLDRSTWKSLADKVRKKFERPSARVVAIDEVPDEKPPRIIRYDSRPIGLGARGPGAQLAKNQRRNSQR